MSEDLCTNRPELALEELDIPKRLEESIVSGSTVRSDGNIDRQAGIRSRTTRKWLNRLGYKWKEVQKGVFVYGHERKDVVEYREIFLNFLNEMKSILSYFVEFSDNRSMLPKKYPENCAVGGPDQRPIIMITYYESTFSANDGRQKV